MAKSYPVIPVDAPTWRLIPTHYPPIQLFESLLDADELEAAYELEALTNDRLRDQAGDIRLVAPEDRVVGQGSTPIMAAFTHIGYPSRFSQGHYGVYYAGFSEQTALKEALWSNQRRLEDSSEPEQMVTLRTYKARVVADLIDVRGVARFRQEDWTPCQQYAAKRRDAGDMGLYYSSVRDPGGECLAALRPIALKPAIQTKVIQAYWDGYAFTHVAEIKPLKL